MKQIATLIILLASITFNAQNEQKKQINQINYLTGSIVVSGYKIVTHSVDATAFKIESSLPAPILQIYIAKKKEFIGGTLIDTKGKTTKIVDLKFESTSSKDNIFTVVGKDFSMGFKIIDGSILLEEKNDIVFYTDNIGIWKIQKK